VAVDARIGRSGASRRRAPSTAGRTLPSWPPQWPAEAWWSIGITALFLCLTVWWIETDQSVPISDAGFHLGVAIEVFKDLQAGHFSKAVEPHLQYPPLLYLVAAGGAYVGGLGIPAMVIAENLFFVPLMALGCYQLGRLAFSPRAGLLAVVFALGSPLFIKLMHLTMLDAPQAAMAAVSVWLILATRYFKSLRFCAAAGLAIGLGMLTKESLALFVIGPLAVTFVRGGWRNWQGMLVLGAVLLVVAGPWYLSDLTQVQEIGTGAANSGTIGSGPLAPHRFSSENLQWYMWSLLTTQVFLPLFLFSAVGGVWTLVGFVRRRWVSPYAPELAIGAFVAWFGLTQTFVHDNRYVMSMLVYMAIFGSFWIVRLPRPGRIAATAALVAVALANTLASTFGAGGIWSVTLPHSLQGPKTQPGFATIYSNEGYLVSAGPYRHGDMLGTLRALKSRGVVGVLMLPSEATNEAAFEEGLLPLTEIANLQFGESSSTAGLSPSVAVFDREKLGKSPAPPCVTLNDGTGVWIRLGDPYAAGSKDFCPAHKPQFYTR
jgi:Dolichyl-phosphate-mannose-protein mannosyltransferase